MTTTMRAPRQPASSKPAKPRASRAKAKPEAAAETVAEPVEVATIGHNSGETTMTIDQISRKLIANENSMLRSRVKHALDQGQLLVAARNYMTSDTEFGQWLKEEGIVDYIDVRTTYNFRILWENFGHLSVEQVTRIGLTNCYNLASHPDEVKAEAIAATKKAGTKLSGRDVSAIISHHVGEKIKDTARPRRGADKPAPAANWTRAVVQDIEDAEVIHDPAEGMVMGTETVTETPVTIEGGVMDTGELTPKGLLTPEQYERLLVLVEGDAELLVILRDAKAALV